MSSIYLPDEVKARLIRAARRRGFRVKQGANSQLAEYIAYLVENDERAVEPRPRRNTLDQALKLLDRPGYEPPTDEEVDQILHERRMRH